MSNNVDNRIVNMQFNNAQFEAGVKQTITSLESLKEALKMNTAVNGLNTIQSAANSFTLSNIENSVSRLSDRFSTLGIVGMTAVSNITNSIINFAKGNVFSLLNNSLNQIKTGGWNRASSVAQSRFTLEGLLQDADKVSRAFEIAGDAVDGTAYSLDAAVSATSQLVASGVDIETKLGGSLKAIAGTAAMTNRDFSDIAHIFTTVAGNGRLMGMQLTQLSTYGLNAAATLGQVGKYAGKTEAEIRDMVSKGQISFQDFSDAMEEAFGDHAKEANNTFTGAMSNIRSALSRIGEVFASGIIENKDVIEFLNYIRIGINRAKASVEKLKEPFKNLVSAVTKFASSYFSIFEDDNYRFNALEKIVSIIQTGIEYVTELIGNFKDLKNEVEEQVSDSALGEAAEAMIDAETKLQIAKEIWEKGIWGNGQTRIDKISEKYGEDYPEDIQKLVNAYINSGYSWEAVDKLIASSTETTMETVTSSTENAGEVAEETSTKFKAIQVAVESIKSFGEGVKKIFSGIKTIATKLVTTFQKVFSWTDLIGDIQLFGGLFSQLASYFEITGERADKIEKIFEGLWSGIDLLRKLIRAIAIVLTNTLGPAAGGLYDILLSILATVGEAITKFNEWIENNETLSMVIETIISIISNAIGFVKEFFSGLAQMPVIDKLKDSLSDLASLIGEKLSPYFETAKGVVGDFFKGLQGDENSDAMQTLIANINSSLEKMLELFGKAGEKIKDVFGWYSEKEAQLAETEETLKIVTASVTNLKSTSEKLTNSKDLSEFTYNLTSAFSKVGSGAGSFVKTIVEKFQNLDVAKLAVVGFAGSIATFFFSLSYLSVGLTEVIKTFKTLPDSITGVLSSIKMAILNVASSVKDKNRAKVIKAYAIAIGVLAASLVALTFVDQEKLKVAAAAMSVLMFMMVLMTKTMTKAASNVKDAADFRKNLKVMAIALVALAASVWILASALINLSTINYGKNIIGPAIALISLIGILIGVAVALSKFAPKMSTGGFGLLMFAAAVWVLTKALKNLEDLHFENVEDKLTTLGEALLAVGIISIMASKMTFSAGVGLLLIILSIYLVMKELEEIDKFGLSWNDIKDHFSKFIIIIGALIVIVGLMAAASKFANTNGAASLLLTVISIYILVKAISKLTDLASTNSKALGTGLIALSFIMFNIIFLILAIATVQTKVTGIGRTVLSLSISIGILALVAAALSKLNFDEFVNGWVCLTMLVAIIGLLVAISEIGGKVDGKSIFALVAALSVLTILALLLSFIEHPEKMILPSILMAGLLIALGYTLKLAGAEAEKINTGAVIAMVIGLGIIAVALYALSNYCDWRQLLVASAAISLVLLSLGWAISVMESKFKGSVITGNRLLMVAMMIASIGVIATSLYILVKAMGNNYESVAIAALMIILVLASIIGAIAVMSVALGGVDVKLEMLAQLAVLIIAIIGIATALSMIIPLIGNNYDAAGAAAFAIIGVLVTIAGLVVALNSVSSAINVNVIVTLGVVLAGIIAIAYALKMLLDGQYDYTVWDAAAKGLFETLGTLVLALSLLGVISKFAGGGVIIATLALIAMLVTLSFTLKPIAEGVDMLITAVGKLASIDWGAIDATKMFTLVYVLSVFGAACLIAGAGLAVLGAGLALAGISAGIIVLELVILSTIIGSLASGITAISTAITLFGLAMSTSSTQISSALTTLAKGLVTAIVTFLSTLAENKEKIRSSLSDIIETATLLIFDFINAIVVGIADGLISILTTLEEKSPELAEKSLNILVTVLNAIASQSRVIGYYGAYIAVAFITGVIEGLNATLPDLLNSVAALAVVLVAGFANAVYENEEGLIDAFSMLGMVLLRTLVDAFNIAGIFDSSLAEIDGEIEYQKAKLAETGYLGGSEYTTQMAEGMDDNKQDTIDTAEGVVDEATDQSDTSKVNAKKTTKAYSSGLIDSLKSTGSDVKDTILGNFDIDGASIPTDGIISGFTGNINSGIKESKVDVSHIPASVREQLEKEEGYSLSDDGKFLVKQVQSGIDESAIDFSTPYSDGETELFNMMDSTADDSKEKGENVGGYFGEGVYDGMDAWKESLYNKAYELGDTMVEGTKDATDEQSPSKKGFEIGKFWDIGIANGISAFASRVTDTTSAMATGIVTSTAAMMSLVSEIINSNTDLQPVIAPVVDTSSIDIASGSISALFGTSSLAANAALSVDNASENNLANQVGLLAKRVDDLANTDYSKILEGVAINVDASTNVDGTSLRQTSSRYTIQQINNQQRSYIRALGGRA
jgi:tape measure domain-containing protein